jgi:predicted transcriptional regulator
METVAEEPQIKRRQHHRPHQGGIELDLGAQKALRRSIAIRGWSTDEFAARAGVAHSTIARILRGERVTQQTLLQVTDALRQGRVIPDLAAVIDGRFDG